MREIEFRGYDLDTKRWYYGSYVRLERYSGYAMSQTPEADNAKHEAEAYDDYIFFTEMNDWGLETRKLKATVIRESVGQYTGLRDSNGKKIYEGDIIVRRWSDGSVLQQFEVKWFDDKCGYNINPALLESIRHNQPTGMSAHGFEVIGNSYQNKDIIQ